MPADCADGRDTDRRQISVMKDKLRDLMQLLSFRTILEGDEEDDWEDFDLQDDYISGAENASGGSGHASGQKWIVYAVIALLAVLAVAGYSVFTRRHTFTGYRLTDSYPSEDISGTMYLKLGGGFIKYGSDGVTYVDGKNQTQWSNAYTMETPVGEVCGDSLMIYEQQGYQVMVLNRDGVLGSFETDLPILKAEVSASGVVGMMLREDENIRIRLCGSDGTTLAEIRTTLQDAGHPIDIAMSSNAQQMMVSLVRIGSGSVDSTIAFYDFSSASKSDESHLAASLDYRDVIFPSVFYAKDSCPVAVGDSMFVTFDNSRTPKQDTRVNLDSEIVSVFHDEKHIGFVLPSDSGDQRYNLQVYRYNGERTAQTLFQTGYSEVSMDSGEILMFDAGHIMSFTTGGVRRLDADYDKQIGNFVKIPGFRRYAVLTNSGIDRIKIE
jgi:hypothetical protein